MAGYSKTPLIQKLGMKSGMRASFLRMPASVRQELSPLPEDVDCTTRLRPNLDYIHYFTENIADLTSTFPRLQQALNKHGMLWISWRKGRLDTDLTEDHVRNLALRNGLVDVKVCAVDDRWSALKLVYRLRDRKAAVTHRLTAQ